MSLCNFHHKLVEFNGVVRISKPRTLQSDRTDFFATHDKGYFFLIVQNIPRPIRIRIGHKRIRTRILK